MRVEIPQCKRCCFCFPLRYGILFFGYVNLMFTCFLIGLFSWLLNGDPLTRNFIHMYRGVGIASQVWFPLILYAFDIIFIIVLIVGAHMKNDRLLRVYYYYGLMTTLAAMMMLFVMKLYNPDFNWRYELVDICFVFTGFGIQIYLLLIIRSHLNNNKQRDQHCYVNHLAEVVVDPRFNGNGRNPL